MTETSSVTTENNQGMLFAFLFNEKGDATVLSERDVDSWKKQDGVLWLCFLQNAEKTRQWIFEKSGFEPQVVDLLTDEDELRPRCMVFNDSLLLFLRAMNLNPDQEPDDMLSVRIYAEKTRIVTLCETPLKSMETLAKKLKTGHEPLSCGILLDEICYAVLDKIMESVDDFDERMNEIEENIVEGDDAEHNVALLSEMRRTLTQMRRYLSPQRYALETLTRQMLSWLSRNDLYEFRENANLMLRILDDIGSLRERALINIDELDNKIRGETQRHINILSVLASMFIPMTFITGLVGMNVKGIPFSDNPNGFLYVVLFLIVLGIVQVSIFKFLKWL